MGKAGGIKISQEATVHVYERNYEGLNYQGDSKDKEDRFEKQQRKLTKVGD